MHYLAPSTCAVSAYSDPGLFRGQHIQGSLSGMGCGEARSGRLGDPN